MQREQSEATSKLLTLVPTLHCIETANHTYIDFVPKFC